MGFGPSDILQEGNWEGCVYGHSVSQVDRVQSQILITEKVGVETSNKVKKGMELSNWYEERPAVLAKEEDDRN